MGQTIQYLFILALVLIVVAYFAGANQLLGTAFGGLNSLGLTYTGRTSSGQFAAYPTGA
jgi:hypothetical protein